MSNDSLKQIFTFISAYLLLFVISTVIVLFFCNDFKIAVAIVAGSIGNTGLGPSYINTSIPLLVKIVLLFDFLAGRIGLWPALLPLFFVIEEINEKIDYLCEKYDAKIKYLESFVSLGIALKGIAVSFSVCRILRRFFHLIGGLFFIKLHTYTLSSSVFKEISECALTLDNSAYAKANTVKRILRDSDADTRSFGYKSADTAYHRAAAREYYSVIVNVGGKLGGRFLQALTL